MASRMSRHCGGEKNSGKRNDLRSDSTDGGQLLFKAPLREAGDGGGSSKPIIFNTHSPIYENRITIKFPFFDKRKFTPSKLYFFLTRFLEA